MIRCHANMLRRAGVSKISEGGAPSRATRARLCDGSSRANQGVQMDVEKSAEVEIRNACRERIARARAERADERNSQSIACDTGGEDVSAQPTLSVLHPPIRSSVRVSIPTTIALESNGQPDLRDAFKFGRGRMWECSDVGNASAGETYEATGVRDKGTAHGAPKAKHTTTRLRNARRVQSERGLGEACMECWWSKLESERRRISLSR